MPTWAWWMLGTYGYCQVGYTVYRLGRRRFGIVADLVSTFWPLTLPAIVAVYGGAVIIKAPWYVGDLIAKRLEERREQRMAREAAQEYVLRQAQAEVERFLEGKR